MLFVVLNRPPVVANPYPLAFFPDDLALKLGPDKRLDRKEKTVVVVKSYNIKDRVTVCVFIQALILPAFDSAILNPHHLKEWNTVHFFTNKES